MTSDRKIETNRQNASRSTGPRTPAGKRRSSGNARRHGLATAIDVDPETDAAIGRLAAVLCEEVDDAGIIEQAKLLASCHFDLQRVRAARFDVFLAAINSEDRTIEATDQALRAMNGICRYETRARSKLKKALRAVREIRI